MRRLSLILGGALVFAAGTAVLGWWTLPVLAAAWGLRGRSADATAAAAVGWGALLAIQATRAPLGPLLERLGGLFRVPGWSLAALTPLFAALLAWSAATVVVALRPRPPGSAAS